jgi:hypothetical protein
MEGITDDKTDDKKSSNTTSFSTDNTKDNTKSIGGGGGSTTTKQTIIRYEIPNDIFEALGQNQQAIYNLSAQGFEQTLLGLSTLSKNQQKLAEGQAKLYKQQKDMERKILALSSSVAGLSVAVSNLYAKLDILIALLIGLIVFIIAMFGLQYYLYKQQEKRFQMLMLWLLMKDRNKRKATEVVVPYQVR